MCDLGALIDALSQCDIDSSTTVVGADRVSVTEDAESHSQDVRSSLTFLAYDVSFSREGRKEISYGRWVGTHWGPWMAD